EQVLHAGVAAVAGRVGDEAGQGGVVGAAFHLVEPAGHLGAEEVVDAVAQPGGGGDLVDQLAVVAQHQVQAGRVAQPGVGQGEAGEGVVDVAHLGGRAPQELAADGRVEEELADLDARARGAVPRPDGGEVAAVALDGGAVGQAGRTRLEDDVG